MGWVEYTSMKVRTKTRKDGILISTVAGMIAALAKDVPNYILVRLGVIKLSYWLLAASTFVERHRANEFLSLSVGAIADIILGGSLGLSILVIFCLFGRDLWWYKGLVAGNIIWLLGAGLAVNNFARIVPVDPVFRLTSLLDHQLFGLVAAYLIWRWSKTE